MEHNEAIEMMASEKYLLDELEPELRDAFEEHYFECMKCAQDVQLGAAFIDHTKLVLPEMMTSAAPVREARAADFREGKEKREWFAWLRPAMLVPAFGCLTASLLFIIGYQNLVVYPAMHAQATALQAAAIEPRILPTANVFPDKPRSAVPVIFADLNLGSTVTVEMPGGLNYSSYKLDFYDSKGKMIWTRTMPSDGKGDDMISFWLSSMVKQDTYKVVISGVGATGEVTWIKQQSFELQNKK